MLSEHAQHLSRDEFAAYCGVGAPTIFRWVNDGLPTVFRKPKIIIDASVGADWLVSKGRVKEWKKCTAAIRKAHARQLAEPPAKSPETVTPSTPIDVPGIPADDNAETPTTETGSPSQRLTLARIRTEAEQYRKLRIVNDYNSGLTVSKQHAKTVLGDLMTDIRLHLSGLPSRLATILENKTADVILKVLQQEITDAVSRYAERAKRQLAKRTTAGFVVKGLPGDTE